MEFNSVTSLEVHEPAKRFVPCGLVQEGNPLPDWCFTSHVSRTTPSHLRLHERPTLWIQLPNIRNLIPVPVRILNQHPSC